MTIVASLSFISTSSVTFDAVCLANPVGEYFKGPPVTSVLNPIKELFVFLYM